MMGMFLGGVMGKGGSVDLKVSEEWHEQKLNSWESGGSYCFGTTDCKCLRKGRSHMHCKVRWQLT